MAPKGRGRGDRHRHGDPHGQAGRSGPGDRPGRELARQVSSLVQQGADIVEAYLDTRASTSPTDVQEAARLKAVRRHEKSVRRYERSLIEARRGVVGFGIASAGLGGIGLMDAAMPMMNGPAAGFLIGSAVTGLVALRKWAYLRNARPPSTPALPPAPVPRLPATAIGAAEAERLARVRRQLHGLVTSVTTIHPDAGRELSRADDEAGPALVNLVGRLAVLDRIRTELADSPAAAAATTSAEQVRERLMTGVETYEQLLAAGATMMAAPDLGRSSVQVLTPAIEALHAYAHGLASSAGTFDPDA